MAERRDRHPFFLTVAAQARRPALEAYAKMRYSRRGRRRPQRLS